MANPYEKYAAPTRESDNPYSKYKPKEKSTFDTVMSGDLGQLAFGALEAIPSLPGAPVELASWAKGVPLEGSNLENWGSQGWTKYFENLTGKKLSGPAPENEVGQSLRKLGNFIGSAALAGPTKAMAPALTSAASGYGLSEIGRKTDEAGLTGGYGEVLGGIAGGMAPGLISGQLTSGIADAPSIEALRQAKNAAYRASEAEGAIFTPAAMQRLHADVLSKAADFGFDPANEPGIEAAIKRIKDAAESPLPITLKGLDTIRKVAGNAGRDFTKPSQQELSRIVKDAIDNVADTVQPHEVLSGDAAKATELLKRARYLNQRMRLAEVIDEAGKAGKNNASVSGVGGNADNAMRQKIRDILKSKKRRAGFSKEEQAMMQQIVDGTKTQNALRWAGGFSPAKGFLPAVLAGHLASNAASGGLTGAYSAPVVLGLAGATAAKMTADAMTKANFARLSARVRAGRATPATKMQLWEAAVNEMKRRAALAGSSTGPALASTANTRSQ